MVDNNRCWLQLVRASLQPCAAFPAAGVAACVGAALVVDDTAGETDQDRGEGGAPFPAAHLPDGGSGSSARVVPDYFGTDWAVASGNRDVRMKADRIKTTATTEEVSSHPGENGHWRQKWRPEHPLAPGKKPMADWKILANRWSRRKIKKDAHAGRGQEAKWEIPAKIGLSTR